MCPLPARSTISNYDGAGKINNQNLPPANDQLDFDNTRLATCLGDVAGLGLTAPRFWSRITLASTTGGMVLLQWYANWSNVTNTLPVLARSGTGAFTITLPTFVSDEYDASVGTTNNIAVNLFAAQGGLEGSTFGFINCSASGNIITIKTANAAGGGSDLAGVNAFIVAY